MCKMAQRTTFPGMLFFIEVGFHFEEIARDKSRVMIWHFVSRAIRHPYAEGLKRICPHQFLQFQCVKHTLLLTSVL